MNHLQTGSIEVDEVRLTKDMQESNAKYSNMIIFLAKYALSQKVGKNPTLYNVVFVKV